MICHKNRVSVEVSDASVVEYLRRENIQYPELYSKLIICGTKPSDIIKFIKNPDIEEKWGSDYTTIVCFAIDFIYDNIIVPYKFPRIAKQTQEDIILAKILKNAGSRVFNTSSFLTNRESLSHVISFLQRDEIIHDWNAYFLIAVKHEVTRVKMYLLKE